MFMSVLKPGFELVQVVATGPVYKDIHFVLSNTPMQETISACLRSITLHRRHNKNSVTAVATGILILITLEMTCLYNLMRPMYI